MIKKPVLKSIAYLFGNFPPRGGGGTLAGCMDWTTSVLA
jgi:hypothetical protein